MRFWPNLTVRRIVSTGGAGKFTWQTVEDFVVAETPVPAGPDEMSNLAEIYYGDGGDEDELEEFYDDGSTVYFVAHKKPDILEARLTPDERRKFNEAKDKALQPWLDNRAWEAAEEDEVGEGEDCPLRFLLKWKLVDGKYKANARVILQGFKHKDVLEKALDKESPTLSRLGRFIIYQILVTFRWKFFSADVKSAFLQGDDTVETEGIRIYGKPNADMRRRLSRMMGLKPSQILRMRKPTFGDVRAPRQWNTKATSTMENIGFVGHPLDKCIFLSFREPVEEDSDFVRSTDVSGRIWVLDGILGLHVDDYGGGGAGLLAVEDLQQEAAPETFLWRCQLLSQSFRFGKWNFSNSQIFTGTEVYQSDCRGVIETGLESYLHKCKPLSIEKNMRAEAEATGTPKEQSQYRGLCGTLAWPAAQVAVHGAATVSLAQAAGGKCTISDMLALNKSLRFMKENSDLVLRFVNVGPPEDLRLGSYFDGAWASRPDLSSQIGALLFVVNDAVLDSGKAAPIVV